MIGKMFTGWSDMSDLVLVDPNQQYSSSAEFLVTGANPTLIASFARIPIDVELFSSMSLDKDENIIAGDPAFSAIFEKIDRETGEITVNPTVIYYGDEVKFTWDNKQGYQFSKWEVFWDDNKSVLGTNNELQIEVTKPMSIQPVISKDLYEITISPSDGGVAESSHASAYWNEKVKLSTIAQNHWHFVNWEGSGVKFIKNGEVESPEIEITIEGDVQLKAKFHQNEYFVDFEAYPNNAYGIGDVLTTNEDQRETFNFGDTVRVSAIPNNGKKFANWSNDTPIALGSELSDSIISIYIESNTTLNPIFENKIYTVSQIVKVADTNGDNYINGGQIKVNEDGNLVRKTHFEHGETIQFIYEPSNGYKLDYWEVPNNDARPTGNSYSYNVIDKNVTLTAVVSPRKYELVLKQNLVDQNLDAIQINNSNFNETEKTFYFDYGDQIQLSAVPNPGFRFDQWIATGVRILSPDNRKLDQIIEINNDIQLEALFYADSMLSIKINMQREATQEDITNGVASSIGELITLDSPNETGRIIEGTKSSPYNRYHPISVEPKDGYKFSHWVGVGIRDYNSSITTIRLDTNKTISAVFELLDKNNPPTSTPKEFSLKIYPDNWERGTVYGSVSKTSSWNEIIAIPKENFEFSHWSAGEEVEFKNIFAEETEVLVNKTTIVTAHFQKLAFLKVQVN